MSNLLNVKFPSGSIFIGGITPQGHLSVAPKPMIHTNAETASNEAVRLATTNPGKQFVILQVLKTAYLPANPAIQWG